MVERRSGGAYEPRLAGSGGAQLCRDARGARRGADVGAGARGRAVPADLDRGRTGRLRRLRRSRAFTDLKSPWLREHSTGVAELAEAAAWRLGLPADAVTRPYAAPRSRTTSAGAGCRTRSGRSPARSASASGSGFGCTPTSPSARSPSRRRSRRSAFSPDRTMSGSTAPATTAARAHRRSIRRRASSPPPTAMRRCARRGPTGRRSTREAAEAELLARPSEGRLDQDAVDAVLAAAGHRVRQRPRELPAGLTERELEVLLVLVRGAVEPGDRRRPRHLRQDRRPPRRSTSTRRPASAAGRPRRSGRSSTTSFVTVRAVVQGRPDSGERVRNLEAGRPAAPCRRGEHVVLARGRISGSRPVTNRQSTRSNAGCDRVSSVTGSRRGSIAASCSSVRRAGAARQDGDR